MNLTVLKCNLDGVANVQLTEEMFKGDFVIVDRDDPEKALYKVNSVEEKEINMSLVKTFQIPKEVYYSFDEYNTVISGKKYFIKEKVSKGQRVSINDKYYEVKDVIKLENDKKEIVLEKIETKKVIQVYTVKKVYFAERNKLKRFKREEIAVFADYADALIYMSKKKMSNTEKEIGYSL